jgi:arylsulfatase A-like enzyme
MLPLLHGAAMPGWQEFVVSEYDYSMLDTRVTLRQPIPECRLFMVFDGRWKYIHAPGFRPMLFDLAEDPRELTDLGSDPRFETERGRLRDALFGWALRDHARITMPDARIAAYADGAQIKAGILIGYWDEAQIAEARRPS